MKGSVSHQINQESKFTTVSPTATQLELSAFWGDTKRSIQPHLWNTKNDQQQSNQYSSFHVQFKRKKGGLPWWSKWLRICLPKQGTWVQFLVQEDPTNCRATTPVHRDYWARVLQLLKPVRLSWCSIREASAAPRSPCAAIKCSPHLLQLERAHVYEDPAQPKINKYIYIYIYIFFFKERKENTSGTMAWRAP